MSSTGFLELPGWFPFSLSVFPHIELCKIKMCFKFLYIKINIRLFYSTLNWSKNINWWVNFRWSQKTLISLDFIEERKSIFYIYASIHTYGDTCHWPIRDPWGACFLNKYYKNIITTTFAGNGIRNHHPFT